MPVFPNPTVESTVITEDPDDTFSAELPKIEEYIKEKIQQEFINTYEGTKPSLDDLYKFIDRGIKFLLFKYTDKDDTNKLKTIYNLTDADIIKLKNITCRLRIIII